MSTEEHGAQPFVGRTRSDAASGRSLRIAVLLVGAVSLGVVAAKLSGARIPSAVVVVAIVLMSVVAIMFALAYRFRRTRAPEERAALAADLHSRHDRIRFVKGATKYEAPRSCGRVRKDGPSSPLSAIFGSATSSATCSTSNVGSSIGTAAPYDVCTGEDVGVGAIGSVAVGRELVVRVDPADRERVAVDWDQSLQLRQASG